MTADSSQTSSLQQFVSLCQQRIEAGLGNLFSSDRQHAQLQDAMAYASLNGGKRIRPVLVYGAALAAGGELAQGDAPAIAVELVHCYSLVHDDLPAMDDDDLRRGKPTVHKAFGEATAILVGDALLTLAFQVLAETGSNVGPGRQLDMIRVLARAAGHQGMVAGQALDFDAVGKSLDIEQLQAMHALKTGALISASVELGALTCPGIETGRLAVLRNYARRVGLAFQIQDDVLDVISDTATLGKPQGSDQALNKPTYTSLLGLEEARQRAAELVNGAIADLADFGDEAAMLRQLARYIVDRVH